MTTLIDSQVDAPTVAVCVITFRRPKWIEKLLRGLNELSFTDLAPDLQIVVVENESNGPARDVCARLRRELRFPLVFAAEPQRGISFARNRAVRTAGSEVDYLAFIDDDEVPVPGWLDALLAAAQKYQADIVCGPVVPVYDEATPRWVVRGLFHHRRRHATGTTVVPMGAGNVLMRRRLLDQCEPVFDERFALGGGEDSHLFQRLLKNGCRAVWADEAVAHEWVPLSRSKARWILARAYGAGASFSFTMVDVENRATALCRIGVRAAMHLGWGVVGLPLALLRGWHALVKQGEHLARGAGILAGLFGYRYQEYRHAHQHGQ